MTLPKRGSRTITVDDVTYRWKPSPMRGFEPPMMSFVCHLDTKPSDSTLSVSMWERHCSIVTPEIVATMIRAALAKGWKPKTKGSFFIHADEAMNLLGA